MELSPVDVAPRERQIAQALQRGTDAWVRRTVPVAGRLLGLGQRLALESLQHLNTDAPSLLCLHEDL